MSGADRDPVERAAGDDRDLYGIATWENRSLLDRLSVAIYVLTVRTAKVLLVLLALVILLGTGLLGALAEPAIGVLTAISILPALALAVYVWYADVTAKEPLSLLVVTFLLGVLMASFAAVLNGLLQPFFAPLGLLGLVAFFYVVVGPVEEAVKLLAVRLYAYTDRRFNAVIVGAVYGAVAGLGFATIENVLYISQAVQEVTPVASGLDLIGFGADVTAIRALAGPGHVIYSAFAGYYLGLAKFNPGNRGPIVVKGLLVAAVIHATYNATVGIGSALVQTATGLPELHSFFVYVVLYVGLFGLVLYRKLERYRSAYRSSGAGQFDDVEEAAAETE